MKPQRWVSARNAAMTTQCLVARLNPPYGAKFLTPGVAAAAEEPILVVVGGGLTRGLDGGHLLQRLLDRRAFGDGVEPARQVGVVVPFHAMRIVVAGPREGRDVGDRVLVATEKFRVLEPLLQ